MYRRRGGSSIYSRRPHQPGNELACSRQAHTYSMYHYPNVFLSTSMRTCVRYRSLSPTDVSLSALLEKWKFSALSFVIISFSSLWIRRKIKIPLILVRVLLSDRRIGVRLITIRHYRHWGIWGFCHLAPFLPLLSWRLRTGLSSQEAGGGCMFIRLFSVGLGCG